jgi:hypothetical protein
VDALLGQVPGIGPESVCFIHLCGRTLCAFLRTYPGLISGVAGCKMVIIVSPRLMPLAKYFASCDDRVLAVFPSGLPVRRLVTALTHPVSRDRFRTSRSAMSSRDIYILRHHLGAGPVSDLSEKYALSVKAIYWRKVALARMLGVRKLEHLLFVD